MNSFMARSSLALAILGALATACANEGSPYRSPWAQNQPVGTAPERGTTTTTSAPVSLESGGLALSEGLIKACQIHFDNVEQAPKFDFDTSDLNEQDRAVLQQIASCVTTGP